MLCTILQYTITIPLTYDTMNQGHGHGHGIVHLNIKLGRFKIIFSYTSYTLLCTLHISNTTVEIIPPYPHYNTKHHAPTSCPIPIPIPSTSTCNDTNHDIHMNTSVTPRVGRVKAIVYIYTNILYACIYACIYTCTYRYTYTYVSSIKSYCSSISTYI